MIPDRVTKVPGSEEPLKVSVLMTYFNKGAYVQEAVRSVLSSTFTDFELILVDDASTDDGLLKVRAMGDPRIIVLESPVNTGRAAAANRGLVAARGEYVAVLDADDLMHPERLARQVAYLDCEPGVAVCGSWMLQFGAVNGVLEGPVSDELIRSRMLQGIPLFYGSSMFRRSCVERGVRCDPAWRTPGMDHLFLVDLGAYGRYATIPETLTYYRMGEQNMAHGRDLLHDRRLMLVETFRKLGIKATEMEVEYQLVLHGMRNQVQSTTFVRGMKTWTKRLLEQNAALGIFPEEPFKKELAEQWDRAFFAAADSGLAPGIAHLCLSKRLSPARLYYLLRRSLAGR